MRSLLHSRRGSTSFATVIALVPLIGVVAIGAEAGSWYVTHKNAQNAADAAAYAGALRLACTLGVGATTCPVDPQDVDYRGREFAAQNMFCGSSDSTAYPGPNGNCATLHADLPARITQAVQIDIGDYNAPTFTTPPAGSGNAVRARVSQQQPAYLAAVLGLTTVNIPAQAIALVEQPSKVCALALGPDPNAGNGALKIAGNVSNNGTGCPIMSDASVQFASTATFNGTGWAVLGTTGCSPTSTCTNPGVTHNYFMPYAYDPLSVLNSESFNTMPTMSGSVRPKTNQNQVPCSNFSALLPPPPANATCYSLIPNTAGTAYGNLVVNGGTNPDYVAFVPGTPGTPAKYFFNGTINDNGGIINFGPGTYYLNGNFSGAGTGGTVNFGPGTYFFNNSAINFSGGNITCTACTPWPPNGTGLGVTLVLLGSSSFSISGGANVSLSAPYTNTFSSDLNGILIDDQAPNKSSNSVNINGGTVKLGGSMYFPNVAVTWNGSAQSTNTTCAEVIAGTLTMGGGGFLSTDGCLPATVAYTQVVRLVQ